MMKRLPVIFFAILLAACVHSNAVHTADKVTEYDNEPFTIINVIQQMLL